MAEGYLVLTGDGVIDPDDPITGNAVTFDSAEVLGAGSWVWTGIWADDGQFYEDIFDTGTFHLATDGNVYFTPDIYIVAVLDSAVVTEAPSGGDPGGDSDVIIGTAGDDILNGGDGNESLVGAGGDDTLYGDAGDDTLSGGAGDDTVYGGTGNDTFVVTDTSEHETIFGGDPAGDAGGDSDTLIFTNDSGTAGVNVVFTGEAAGDFEYTSAPPDQHVANGSFAGIEAVTGTGNADSIDASITTTGQTIDGGAGDDRIIGGSGDDTLAGGEGNDRITGGDGNDLIDGGAGEDTLTGGAGDDTILGGEGNDDIYGDNSAEPVPVPDTAHLIDWTTAEIGTPFVVAAGDSSVTITVETPANGAGQTFQPGDTLAASGATADPITTTITFDQEVMDVTFTLWDVDAEAGVWDDRVTIIALDAEGNQVPVTFSSLSTQVVDNTIIEGGGNTDGGVEGTDAPAPVLVTIPGPITSITIVFDAGDSATTAGDIAMGDIAFSTVDYAVPDQTGGDDHLFGGDGDDIIYGGAGADVIDGGAGNDLIDIGANDGAVDRVIIANGSGQDTVTGFEGPIDNGDGTWTGRDQIDVSGLTDANGIPVTVVDVFVDEDIDGNAVLVFPNGETVTLIGIDKLALSDPAALAALGIPVTDHVVEGTAGDDVIDAGYSGDPTGDRVDNGDAPDLSDDDTILGLDGNDTIRAGAGNDTVFGGDGDDTLFGGDGDDTLFGGLGNDILHGDAGNDTLHLGKGDEGYGGEGADTFVLTNETDPGTILIAGGDGQDIVDASARGADQVLTLDGSGTGTLDDGTTTATLDGIEAIILGAGNDTAVVQTGTAPVTISGGTGFDSLQLTGADITAEDLIGFDDTSTGIFTAQDGTAVAFGPGEAMLLSDVLATWGNGTVTLIGSDLSGSIDRVSFDGFEDVSIDIICFTRGTRIKTAMGEVAVEDLASGDRVLTLDSGYQKIRWIGSTTRPARGALAPILIRAGVLDNDRDLRVSPQHRMLLRGWQASLLFGESEVLVAAKALVNDRTILRDEGGTVEYFHILFDRHEIIFAEGAPSESFHPGQEGWKALDQATRDEIIGLFPMLGHRDFAAYGPAARTTLRGYEARTLALRMHI